MAGVRLPETDVHRGDPSSEFTAGLVVCAVGLRVGVLLP